MIESYTIGNIKWLINDPENQCWINRSVLKRFAAHRVNHAVAIKYVAKGTEHYQSGKKAYRVSRGQCLLFDQGEEVHVRVESQAWTEGICLDLGTEKLAASLSGLCDPNQIEPDCLVAGPAIPSQVFPIHTYEFGDYLKRIAQLTDQVQDAEEIRLGTDPNSRGQLSGGPAGCQSTPGTTAWPLLG
ncbi:MAG: AraC family ligand binding domain-containing protein, partial [Bacteroidota bacterium]